MKKNLLLLLLLLIGTIAVAQTTWTGGGADTNWNNTDNWSTNLVPTALDDVIIPTGFTVTLNVSGNVRSINVQGTSVFNINANLTFSEPSAFDTGTTVNWNVGILNGTGSILTNAGTIAIASSNVNLANGTTLTNNGNLNFTGAGNLFIATNAILNNSLTGIIDFQAGNSGISPSGVAPRLLNNSGVIKTSFATAGPTDQANISVELKNNDGTIQVEVGTLNLSNSIVNSIELTDGVYNVFADAALDFDSSVTLSGSLTGTLNGDLNWRSNVYVNSPNTATFNFTGNATVSWVTGTLQGGGTLVNESIINTLASNVTINGATTLTNNDTINLTGGGNIFIGTNSIINNSTSGIIDFQADNSGILVSGAAPNILNNFGLLKGNAPTTTATIGVEVTNTGTIEAASGTLNFTGTLDHQISGIATGIAILNLPSIANLTNNGTFSPGASPGTLTVVGNYTSTANTVLDIDLNGLTPDIEHDVLAISGTSVVFEGTVDVSMGFEGTVGDSFTIATTTGTIVTTNLESPIENVDFDGKRYTFEVSYPDNNKVVLTITDKLDILPPDVVTQNITVQLDNTGNVSIIPTDIDNGSTDNCTPTNELQFSLDISSFTCADLGDNTVTLTVTDNDGNFADATATVTVEDNIAPTVVTQNITVQLDASGNASIIGDQIDGGSSDNCTVSSLVSDITDFTCANLGDNTVELTVTDQSGNFASALANVTVEDNIAPTVVTQNITIQLDDLGNASITANQIDNGSSDNCSVSGLSLDISDFTCTDLGDNTVQLTVTDQSGNSASANAIVTVEDVTPPTVATQNITVQLDATGNVSVLAAQIDNGSSDNCSVTGLSLNVSDFTCSDLGVNTVELTVTDQIGNSATATATVTVEDLIAPVITCPADLNINSTGPYTLPDFVLQNEVLANDNCSFSIVQNPAPGTELPDGNYIISFTVTDSAGNEDSCSFELTVKDDTLGVGDQQLSSDNVIFYPNPVNDVFTLKNNSNIQLINLEIYEISGKLIQTIDLKSMNQTLDVAFTDYSAGVYLIKVNALNSSIIKRVIKN
jgi:hypothetical protein